MGMTKADMVKYLGSQSRVSEILNKKRSLTLKMVKSLYKGLKIPAEILLAQANISTYTKKAYNYVNT